MWDLPGPGIKPMSPASAGGFFTTKPPGKPWAHFLSLPKPYFPFCEKDVIIGLLEEFKKLQAWDFPGGPVVQTPSSQCREHGFDPWLGILPAAWRGQKKKQKNNYAPVRALDATAVVIAVIISTISPGTSALQALGVQA